MAKDFFLIFDTIVQFSVQLMFFIHLSILVGAVLSGCQEDGNFYTTGTGFKSFHCITIAYKYYSRKYIGYFYP